MEPKVINQEVLLSTSSSFCSRQFCKRDDSEDNNDYAAMEELEKACWDGMLYEMLPELAGNPVQNRNNYIWNTTSGVNFLCINLGICSMTNIKQTS
ncbi:MAG TPA: hypothetical protein VH815_05185, partial [Acidobacteriota bacterium]